jgi:hypothetical protein
MQGLDYSVLGKTESFKSLLPIERKRERYIIIYTWKIIENLVLNLEQEPSQ